MRHRRKGRRLGRSSSHRRAMLRNLASSLFLTERDVHELEENPPKHPGRVVTTLQKAKEVRPLVEKCITIARHSLADEDRAEELATTAARNTEEWKQWRNSEKWSEWCQARAPVVAAQRRALQMLGDREAVNILFQVVAPRYRDRDGGYTRVLRLAEPRLGDAGTQAILEFVGKHDRATEGSSMPDFAGDEADAAIDELDRDEALEEETSDEVAEDQSAEDEADQADASDEADRDAEASDDADEEKK